MRASLAKEFPEVRTSTTFSDEYLLAVMSMPDSKNPQVRRPCLCICVPEDSHSGLSMYVCVVQSSKRGALQRPGRSWQCHSLSDANMA